MNADSVDYAGNDYINWKVHQKLTMLNVPRVFIDWGEEGNVNEMCHTIITRQPSSEGAGGYMLLWSTKDSRVMRVFVRLWDRLIVHCEVTICWLSELTESTCFSVVGHDGIHIFISFHKLVQVKCHSLLLVIVQHFQNLITSTGERNEFCCGPTQPHGVCTCELQKLKPFYILV